MTHGNFVDCDFYYKVGDKVALPPAGFSALGWMVCKSPLGSSDAVMQLETLLEYVVMDLVEPINNRLSVRLPSGEISDVVLLDDGAEETSKVADQLKRSPSMLISYSPGGASATAAAAGVYGEVQGDNEVSTPGGAGSSRLWSRKKNLSTRFSLSKSPPCPLLHLLVLCFTLLTSA